MTEAVCRRCATRWSSKSDRLATHCSLELSGTRARRRFRASVYPPSVDKRSTAAPEMTATDVLACLRVMDEAGVRVWLDGGWAVDACLGAQSRRHRDLDIAIEERHIPAAIGALGRRGFASVPAEWNVVLEDSAGRQVDFHPVVLDDDGRGVFAPPRNSQGIPADALSGEGTLGGQRVRCLTPHALVAFHTGYEVDGRDWADVRALCERYNIPIPDDFQRFR